MTALQALKKIAVALLDVSWEEMSSAETQIAAILIDYKICEWSDPIDYTTLKLTDFGKQI